MMPLLIALTVLVAIGTAVTGGLYWRQQKAIAELLGQAEQRLAEGQLVSPAQDNAEHYFQQVLQLDDDNESALSGLERVKQARIAEFVVLGDQRLGEGQWFEPEQDNADFYYREALKLEEQAPAALDGLRRLQEARIQAALQRAEAAFADQRLTTPEDDSALYYYQQVLGWAPGQAAAEEGLTRIAERYRELAQQAYAHYQFPRALEMIERGLEVRPDHPELLRMQREHQSLQASARSSRTQQQQRSQSRPNSSAQPAEQEENTFKRVWKNLFGG